MHTESHPLSSAQGHNSYSYIISLRLQLIFFALLYYPTIIQTFSYTHNFFKKKKASLDPTSPRRQLHLSVLFYSKTTTKTCMDLLHPLSFNSFLNSLQRGLNSPQFPKIAYNKVSDDLPLPKPMLISKASSNLMHQEYLTELILPSWNTFFALFPGRLQ